MPYFVPKNIIACKVTTDPLKPYSQTDTLSVVS